ncbi:MAG TPA: prepilin peptidase [Bryobacteraceae bacterium]|nr:prepilin peptidase [Bryobacteraceae bacterium]
MSDLLTQPLGWNWMAAAFGLLFGSFLNVCISRLPDDYSVVVPRSHCPQCGSWIAWYDNVPLLSFILLGGRCRTCKAPVSWRYPVVEALTGLLFYLAVTAHGPTWAGLKWSIFGAILVALIFTDIETRILPDEFTKSGWILGILLAPIAPLPRGIISLFLPEGSAALVSLADSALTSVLLPTGLYLMAVVYQRIRGVEGLGFGDIKMLGFLGAFLGLESALLALMLGSLIGAVLGLTWIKFRRRDPATYELPFGSFLGIAALIVAFASPTLFW